MCDSRKVIDSGTFVPIRRVITTHLIQQVRVVGRFVEKHLTYPPRPTILSRCANGRRLRVATKLETRKMQTRSFSAIVIGLTAFLTTSVHAQTFPSKTLRIVVPFPAGGGADVMCRVLAENMAKGLGQSFIIENRPGAQAIVGYEYGARAPGDGYTMVSVFSSFVISPLVRDKVPYDPFKDFKAVGEAIVLTMAIGVHPSVPAKSLKELIALARAKPNELGFAAIGGGGLHNIYGELLKATASIKITNIPFQGGTAAAQAVAGGHVPIVVANVGEITPFVKSGRIRALVVSTAARAVVLDPPTFSELHCDTKFEPIEIPN